MRFSIRKPCWELFSTTLLPLALKKRDTSDLIVNAADSVRTFFARIEAEEGRVNPLTVYCFHLFCKGYETICQSLGVRADPTLIICPVEDEEGYDG